MPYTKQTWNNGDPATPLNGTRLNYIEEGIQTAQETAEAATVADGSITDAKVNTTAAIALSKTADTTTSTGRLAMTNAERTKLSGIATSATANSSDATLLARANHTGSQVSTTISDFAEAVDDRVAALLAAGTGATLTYNDGANTLTIAATGTSDTEAIRDAIGLALVGTGVITVTVNDGADTITISSTATANSTDATLLARANHTGTQAQSTVTNLTTDLAAKRNLTAPGIFPNKWTGSAWTYTTEAAATAAGMGTNDVCWNIGNPAGTPPSWIRDYDIWTQG
jgi:hypothetical protein